MTDSDKVETTLTSMDNGLVALNHVHAIASKLWNEKTPTPSFQIQRQKSKHQGGRGQTRRITPVQLPGRNPELSGNERDTPGIRSPLGFGGRNQNRTGPNPNKKRVVIKTLPIKPPDIQNFDLFPPIGNIPLQQRTVSPPTGQKAGKNRKNEVNPFAVTVEESKFDPSRERKKIFTGLQKVQTQITNSSEKFSSTANLTSIPAELIKPAVPTNDGVVNNSTSDRGRSAELFAHLTPEQVEELKRLSESYSESLDSNLCRSILAEFTFLCQLLVANNDEAMTSVRCGQAAILASLAPRVWFVTHVFTLQLPLVASVSPEIIQMLIDFYPHRIPKQLRKKFEGIIQQKLNTEQKFQNRDQSTPTFSNCVIFQTETDGRSNFPHQKDCQDFGKQRDLFYAIREIWTYRQFNQHNQHYDPALGKVKQLFTINSSSTNLSRLASLFISQSLLDLNGAKGADPYDPTSVENVRRILSSNPSKYDKLRQRLMASNFAFEGHHPIADPMAFLKYFIAAAGCVEFKQHLIDHAIHEILKLESDMCDTSGLDAVYQMMKMHSLAQMLGFLHFLPYRDDEYKKPIGPINVEVYLQSQINLRSHQSTPLDFMGVLMKSRQELRLVGTLPWIIEFLSRADPVAFHLPAYRPILSVISYIYRQILSLKIESGTQTQSCISTGNKTLLRFMCGKLFGLPGFPDFYLFGQNVTDLGDVKPDLWQKDIKTVEEESVPLDLEESVSSFFLPIWFRQEMKQVITILSTNATVRGSIPSGTLGLVSHIRPVPEKNIGTESNQASISVQNIQAELEAQFFQSHPSSMKRTIDFIADRVASNFLKHLRSKILGDFRNELIQKGLSGQAALAQCQEKILLKLDSFATTRCNDGVVVLLGDGISTPVLTMCQRICARNTRRKVMIWLNQHVTQALFPEVSPSTPYQPHQAVDSDVKETCTPKASLFLVLRALHNTIQRLHNGLSIEPTLIDRILEDERLCKEKPWVILRTFELALCLITFSASTLTLERQDRFIGFWKKIWNEESFSFLRPRNLTLLSNSPNLKVSFSLLSSLVRKILAEKLVTVLKIQESCMALLQEDWPESTKFQVSEFLKEVLPVMDSTEDKDVIDWIAWYCSGQDEEDF